MSTDLENELRDALHARAAAVTPDQLRYRDAPARRRSRAPAWLIAAAVLLVGIGGLVVLVLSRPGAGRDTAAGRHAIGAALVDTRWRVVAVTDHGTRTRITSYRVLVDFGNGGRFDADDGVNYYSGRWKMGSDGLHITHVGTTLVGYGGSDPAVLAAQRGVAAVTTSAGPVLAQLERAGGPWHSLRLAAGKVVLDLVADGRPDLNEVGANPSPTAARPSRS